MKGESGTVIAVPVAPSVLEDDLFPCFGIDGLRGIVEDVLVDVFFAALGTIDLDGAVDFEAIPPCLGTGFVVEALDATDCLVFIPT